MFYLFLLIGVLMLVIWIGFMFPLMGLYFFYTSRFGGKRGKMARAKILALEEDHFAPHSFVVTIQFMTREGLEVITLLTDNFPKRIPAVGDTIFIQYLVENPQQVIHHSPKTSKILLLGSILFACVFLVIEWWI